MFPSYPCPYLTKLQVAESSLRSWQSLT